MAHELVLTSVRQGLDEDRSGFCAIAKDRNIPLDLERTLEGLSGYHHFYPPESPEAPDNPVARSHLVFRQAGVVYHVLSHISDSGIDFALHSNHIAHHLVLSEDELTREGPAWLLAQPGLFLTEWVGPACLFYRGRPIPTQAISTVPPILEAGDSSETVTLSMTPPAGVKMAPGEEPAWWIEYQRQEIPDILLKAIEQRRSVLIYFAPPMDTLILLAAVLARLPEAERWNVPFTTCYHVPQLENAPATLITCVPHGSNDARLRTPIPGELVIDLTAYIDGGAMVAAENLTQVESHHHEIQEIAPPSESGFDHTSSETFTIRPTDAGRAIDRLLRTRSHLLFYSVYGAATLVVAVLLLLVISRQFGWWHTTTTTGINDPLAQKQPVPNVVDVLPEPLKPIVPEEQKDDLRFQNAVQEIGKVVASIKLPSVIPLTVPNSNDALDSLPKPQSFPEFAPLFHVADALEIEAVPFFVPQDWEFITERDELRDQSSWTVYGYDTLSKQQRSLLAITLKSDGLELSWLPDAATPPECHDAALLALGELVFSTVTLKEDEKSLTQFATIPLWKVVTLQPVLLEKVMEEKTAEVVVPLFFAKSPWNEVFAATGRDITPFLQLDVPPLGGKFTTESTRHTIQTSIMEPRRLEYEVVTFDVQRRGADVVVSDQTRITQAEEDSKTKEDKENLAMLDAEIKRLARKVLSGLANDEDRTQRASLQLQYDALTQEGEQNLKTRELRLETRENAHKEVLDVVKSEKLSADFSLYLLSPNTGKKLLLQTTLTPTPPPVVPLQ